VSGIAGGGVMYSWLVASQWVVTGWVMTGERGEEWMRRGRKGIWEGGHWIIAQQKEGM
jgi:hypothetical protein